MVLGRVPSTPRTMEEREKEIEKEIERERACKGEDRNEGVIIYYVGHSSPL